MRRCLFVTFCLTVRASWLKNIDETETAVRDCLSRIIETTFDESSPLMFVYQREDLNRFVPARLKNERALWNTQDDVKQTQSNRIYRDFVLLTDDFEATLGSFRNSSLWDVSNVRGKCVVVAFGRCDKETLFEHFWREQIVDVLLVVVEEDLNVYFAYPYTKRNNCGKNVELQLFRACAVNMTFPKFPSYLKDCQMSLSLLSRNIAPPYIDVRFGKRRGLFLEPLYLMRNKFGIEINFLDIPDDVQANLIHQAGQIWLAERINSGRITFFVGKIYRYSFYENDFDFSDVVYFDSNIWIVPKPKLMSKANMLIGVFSGTMWLLCVVAFLLTMLLWMVICEYKKEKHSRNIVENCLTFLELTFATNVTVTRSNVLRLLLLFYLFFCLHVNNFFQGQLSSVLTVPQYEEKIDSLEKLALSNLVTLIPFADMKVLKDSAIPVAQLLYNKSISSYELFPERMEKLLENDSLASNGFRNSMAMFSTYSLFVDTFQDSMLPIVDATYSMRGGSPLRSTLNEIIRGVVEGGLRIKWLSDMHVVRFFSNKEEKLALEIQHLESAFLLLSFGLGIASVILILEHLVYRIKKRN